MMAVKIHSGRLALEIITVEDDGEGSVIVDFDEHHGSKLASFDAADTNLPQGVGKVIHQWRGDIGWGSMDKAGTPSLPAVGIQRELGNHQSLPLNIEKGKVGFAFRVGKDAQVGDLVGQAAGFGRAVAVTSTQEDDQALVDAANGLALYRDLAFPDTLDDCSHGMVAPLDLGVTSVILAAAG
jgi:hypothetical protein